MKRTAIAYREAIRWLVNNDDTEWTADENGCASVTASLVADIYGRTTEEVTADLRAALAKAGAA